MNCLGRGRLEWKSTSAEPDDFGFDEDDKIFADFINSQCGSALNDGSSITCLCLLRFGEDDNNPLMRLSSED